MNAVKRLVFLILLLCGLACAQTPLAVQNTTFTATGTNGPFNEQNVGILFHQIIWRTQGTVTTCSIRVDSSADGSTWNTGDIIAAQTCTSNGSFTSASFAANFVRVNLVTFTGGGTLYVTYGGFNTAPASVGTLPSGLSYSGSTLTVSSAGNGNGTVQLSGTTSGTCSLATDATASSVISNCANFKVGANGTAAGVLNLLGGTSGAWTITPSATGTTGTISGPLLIPSGTLAAPGIGLSSNTNTGISNDGFGNLAFGSGGLQSFVATNGGLTFGVNTNVISWGDTFLSRISGASGTTAVAAGTAANNSLGLFLADGNKAVLTADWTMGTGGTVTSAGPNIIGSGGGVPMTFTLPLVAKSYQLDCNFVVGQATAATANTWSLLTATNGATNVTASYMMATAATAMAVGAVTDQTSTTSSFAIAPTWTLGGTATKMPVHIHAAIEGASASGTVLSVQLTSGAVADLITIYRGSSCHLY